MKKTNIPDWQGGQNTGRRIPKDGEGKGSTCCAQLCCPHSESLLHPDRLFIFSLAKTVVYRQAAWGELICTVGVYGSLSRKGPCLPTSASINMRLVNTTHHNMESMDVPDILRVRSFLSGLHESVFCRYIYKWIIQNIYSCSWDQDSPMGPPKQPQRSHLEIWHFELLFLWLVNEYRQWERLLRNFMRFLCVSRSVWFVQGLINITESTIIFCQYLLLWIVMALH